MITNFKSYEVMASLVSSIPYTIYTHLYPPTYSPPPDKYKAKFRHPIILPIKFSVHFSKMIFLRNITALPFHIKNF